MPSRLAALVLAAAAGCAPPAPPHRFVMPTAAPDARDACASCPRVAVIGEVTAPGFVRFHAGLTVVGAIVAAGGFTALADRSTVVVVRGRRHVHVSVSAIVDGEQPDLPRAPGYLVEIADREI
jgi:hypothetical protein